MKIYDLIEERRKYAIGSQIKSGDAWLEEILDQESQDEVYFITVGGIINERLSLKKIRDKYFVSGVYGLGNIFTNTNAKMYLVRLNKEEPLNVKMSLYTGKAHHSRNGNGLGELVTPDEYGDGWRRYIDLLQYWIDNDDMPSNNRGAGYEFCVLETDEINDNYIPEANMGLIRELKNLLSKEKTCPLSEIADIVLPKVDEKSGDVVKTIRIKDLQYPLDVDVLSKGKITNYCIQEGDILFPKIASTKMKAYLVRENPKEPIYVSNFLWIIRCKSILPEYLCLYLNSNTAIEVINALSFKGTMVSHITGKMLQDLPVIVPTLDEQIYIDKFNSITSKQRFYGNSEFAKMQDYFKHIDGIEKGTEKAVDTEDILNVELSSQVKKHMSEQLRNYLKDDLNELNVCFKNKAYKATLILAGSILEAVLIDWLSQNDHRDYFQEDYTYEFYNRSTGIRETRKVDNLSGYINQIKRLQRPRWMQEADEAHVIRKRRNLVHAKLCLKEEVEINEELCQEVISYLRHIIDTRNEYSS